MTLTELAADKGLPLDFLRALGLLDLPDGVGIPYKDVLGKNVATKLRKALRAKDGSFWPRGMRLMPYGLDRLKEARQYGLLIIVEGESDCWTLWYHGIPALGIPGASATKVLEASYLEGIHLLYVFQEPDQAGAKFVAGVADRVRELVGGETSRDVLIVRLDGVKDPNALHLLNPDSFKVAFQRALDRAEPLAQTGWDGDPQDPGSWLAADSPYKVQNNQFYLLRGYTRDGQERWDRLSNFSCRVVEEVAEDDGADTDRYFVLEGRLHDGSLLPRVKVPAGRFAVMSWVSESWGFGPSVAAGIGARDHLRAAIEAYSGSSVMRHQVFKHTGWREVDGQWVYLHGGGAIGSEGPLTRVEVALSGPLAGYVLPEPPTGVDLSSAIKASLQMLEVAPHRLTVPAYAAIWRAVLGGSDFGLHISGPSGVGKSELAALAQQHFGPNMDGRHLPASWMSTGNYLEDLAFRLKDSIFTVDDFAPTGPTADVQRLHREADRLFRAEGNHAGRGRLNSDATPKNPRPPRALILSTGEDTPRGQSLRARLLISEMSPGDMDWARLESCQMDARTGLYSKALAGFVCWLAPRYRGVSIKVRNERDQLAATASQERMHKRTPRIIADLAVGLKCFVEFATDSGVITQDQANECWRTWWSALRQAAECQDGVQDAYEPSKRFAELLGAAISSGSAHLASPEGKEPANPSAWGWRHRNGEPVPMGTSVAYHK